MEAFVKKLIIVIVICYYAVAGIAQTHSQNLVKIAPAALRSDFALLSDTMRKVHPGMYRYNSKAAVDRVFDSCYAAITDSMTIPQFYMLVNFATASVEDGHTHVNLPKNVISNIAANIKLLPVITALIHNRAYVYCCSDTALKGAELLTINGRTVPGVINEMFKYIASDAGIQSRKNWEIGDGFTLLYNILYGNADSFAITYKKNGGHIKRTTLQAGYYKNFACQPAFTKPAKYLQLSYRPGNIAVLTIKSFFDVFLQQTGENFSAFLDSAFNDIRTKNIKRLLVDIRGNQGGNDGNGILLYSYLVQQPFMYYEAQETVSEKFKADDDHGNLKLQQPKSNSYAGKVFVLADGRSFSVSAEFAAMIRGNKRGVMIGEEVGGGYFGNTSGGDAEFDLPNTGLSCRIPLVKYSSAVTKQANKGNTILPDYPVYYTVQDLINKTDSQLNEALHIAAEK
ncbi:MAG TPA: S41 family peptidase [Chitinophagaceae bacterium]|nr:S41 family peptidase [Chitinophagaceae bacterium]